jgi:hypothetical protein
VRAFRRKQSQALRQALTVRRPTIGRLDSPFWSPLESAVPAYSCVTPLSRAQIAPSSIAKHSVSLMCIGKMRIHICVVRNPPGSFRDGVSSGWWWPLAIAPTIQNALNFVRLCSTSDFIHSHGTSRTASKWSRPGSNGAWPERKQGSGGEGGSKP